MRKFRDLLDGYLLSFMFLFLFAVEKYGGSKGVIYGKTYLYGGLLFLLLTIYENYKYFKNREEEDRKYAKLHDERDLEVELRADNVSLYIIKYLVLGLALVSSIVDLDFKLIFILIYFIVIFLPSLLRKYYYKKI